MAVTGWTTIVEGMTGTEVSNKYNSAFSNIDNRFDEDEADNIVRDVTITDLDSRTTVLEAYSSPLRGSLRLSTSSTQTIDDTAEPIQLTCFDTMVSSVGDVEVDDTAMSITYTGLPLTSVIITLGLNVEFAATEELETFLYVNDVKYSDTPINIQGAGAGKPVSIFWQSDISVTTGDVFTVRGRNADAGSLDVTYLRTTLRLDK